MKAQEKLAAERAKIAEVAAKACRRSSRPKRPSSLKPPPKAQEKLAAEKGQTRQCRGQGADDQTGRSVSDDAQSSHPFGAASGKSVPDDGSAAGAQPAQSAVIAAITAVARPTRSIAAPTSEPTGSIAASHRRRKRLPDKTIASRLEVALAYAEQPGQNAAGALAKLPAASPDALRAGLLNAAAQQAPDTTTVVAKRMNGHSAPPVVVNGLDQESIAAACRRDAPHRSVAARDHGVAERQQFFSASPRSAPRDFRTLSAMMVKPANNLVMMTLSATDPNPGLEYAHFSPAARPCSFRLSATRCAPRNGAVITSVIARSVSDEGNLASAP